MLAGLLKGNEIKGVFAYREKKIYNGNAMHCLISRKENAMVTKGKKAVSALGLVLSIFNLIMFFSMRPCWSGISKTLGYSNGGPGFILNLPVYLCILFFIIALSNIGFMIFSKERKVWPLIYLVLGIVFFAAVIVIIVMGA